MTTATANDRRSDSTVLRASLVMAALILVGTACWFAASWVDSRAYDTTCGSVVRPEIWRQEANPSCQRVMVARAAVSAALITGGGALLYLGLRRRRCTPGFAIAAVTMTVLACGVILVVNEVVRSGGGLSHLTG
jgi:hypothetical protein